MNTPVSFLCLLLLLFFCFVGTVRSLNYETAEESSTIYRVPLSAEKNLEQLLLSLNATTFVSLMNQTNLLSTYLQTNASYPYTIFAPTNEAIAQAAFLKNATIDQIKEVLLYHLTAGSVLSQSLTNGELVPSQMVLPSLANAPQQLKVSVAKIVSNKTTIIIKINNARVISADNQASNGVVHLVSSVIVPPSNVLDVAINAPILSTLVKAVVAAKLQSALTSPNLTVFAPTNDAFGAALTGYLLLPNSSVALVEVLSYHVVPKSVYYASCIPAGTTMLGTDDNGEQITVVNQGGNITINGDARVTQSNVLAANGVVHLISALLLPSEFKFNLENALMGLNATTLFTQIKRAGLEWLVANATTNPNDTHTIFAPSNDAFQSTHAGIAKYSIDKLLNILKTHVVKGRVDSLQKGQQLTNLNNQILVVGDDGTSISVKEDDSVVAQVVGGVNVADNGNVYALNKVLGQNSDSDNEIPEIVVIIVIAVCVPLLIALLGVILLWDLRNWWKKRQVIGYSPISGDEYEN